MLRVSHIGTILELFLQSIQSGNPHSYVLNNRVSLNPYSESDSSSLESSSELASSEEDEESLESSSPGFR